MRPIQSCQRTITNLFCRIPLRSVTCMRCVMYCCMAITLFGLVINNHYYNNPFRAVPHERGHNIYLKHDFSLLVRDAERRTEPEKHDSLLDGTKQQTEPEKHDYLLVNAKQLTETEKHDSLLEATKQLTETDKHDSLLEATKQLTETDKHDSLIEGTKQLTETDKHDYLLVNAKQQTEPQTHDSLLEATKQLTETDKHDSLQEGAKQQTEPQTHDFTLLMGDYKWTEPDDKQGLQHGNYTIPSNTTTTTNKLSQRKVMSNMQTTTRPTSSPNEKVKLVLMWPLQCVTKKCMKERAYYKRPGRFNNCVWKSCKITGETSLLMSSDAVVFRMPKANVQRGLGEFPKQRNISQRWVFFSRETPFHYPYGGHASLHKGYPLYNDVYNGIFNWTMTYRLDSDIPFDYYFAGFVHSRRYNRSFNYGANKTKLVAAIISHCCTVSRRENYLEVLNRTVPVHVYGHCLERPCNGECFDVIADEYKFFIAFENAICKDYITEKFYKTSRANIVPIVMGGANYSHLLPGGSYVDVMDFPSPRDLGKYLLYLDKTHSVYNQMLRLRAAVLIPHVQNGYCTLCEKLHMDKQPKVYEDMYTWWVRKSQCVQKRPTGWMNTSDHGVFQECYPQQLQ